MFPATLSIDLGASYTKIALRKAMIPPERRLAREAAKLLAVGDQVLIPSVAIRTGDKKQPWLFGQNAAMIRPGSDMEVIPNWKSWLFQPANTRESALASVVATQFFEYLLAEVKAAGLDLGSTQVVVAMPAFEDHTRASEVVFECMRLAGWNRKRIKRITEPHANILGLMSQGKSAVGRDRFGEPLLNYGMMFGQSNPWVQGARQYALTSRGASRLAVLVIDVGAFTTDFAWLDYNFSDEDVLGDSLSALVQRSYAHGVIRQLDQPIERLLSERHRTKLSDLSFGDYELIKEALYSRRQIDVLLDDGDPITLGDKGDAAVVRSQMEAFCDQLWRCLCEFLGDRNAGVAYLTGGGTLIPYVREDLRRRLAGDSIRVVGLPSMPTEAEQSSWRRWTSVGTGLERLATALGGTSVVLEVSKEPSAPGEPRVPFVAKPAQREIRPVPCPCGGLNKNCVRCGGLG